VRPFTRRHVYVFSSNRLGVEKAKSGVHVMISDRVSSSNPHSIFRGIILHDRGWLLTRNQAFKYGVDLRYVHKNCLHLVRNSWMLAFRGDT
jgi:hypothetical protein